MAANTYMWTLVEASVGLLCACFPIIGPLFKVLRTRGMTKTGSGRGSGGHEPSALSTIGSKRTHAFRQLREEELTILSKDSSSKAASGNASV
jgi:hypothetical protein